MNEAKRLTTSAGALVANNQDSLTAGPAGRFSSRATS